MSKRFMLSVPLTLALAAAMATTGSVAAAGPGFQPAPTMTIGSAAPAAVKAKVTGYVMLFFANGNFRLNNGRKNFKIAMTRTTSVINLRGREVPRQFIQVANKVTVTGRRVGSKITAKVVLVYTRKDGP